MSELDGTKYGKQNIFLILVIFHKNCESYESFSSLKKSIFPKGRRVKKQEEKIYFCDNISRASL